MKIVFWSCMAGHANVTSNLVACALSAAVDHNYNVSLLQTQYSNNALQSCFISDAAIGNAGGYYQDTGIDSLIRNVTAGAVSKDQVIGCSYSFLKQKLNLYAKSGARTAAVYYKKLSEALQNLLTSVDETYDITFIDTKAGADAVSKYAIEEADVVVVCLPQDKGMIDYFFSAYSIEANNIFYVFGDYDPNRKLNLKTLQRMYKKKFTKDNCSYILHSAEFADAMDNQSVISYFLAHRRVGTLSEIASEDAAGNPLASRLAKKDANTDFMKSVRMCTSQMLKHAGVKLYLGGDE